MAVKKPVISNHYSVSQSVIRDIQRVNPPISETGAAIKLLDDIFGNRYSSMRINPSDSFEKTASDIDEAGLYTKEMEGITKLLEYPLRHIDLFTVREYNGKELIGWINLKTRSPLVCISNETLIRAGADALVMKELLYCGNDPDQEYQMMLIIIRKDPEKTWNNTYVDPDEIFFVGATTFFTLFTRCGLSKTPAVKSTYPSDRIFRNSLMRSFISHEDGFVKILYREFRKDGYCLKKVFGFFSNVYGMIPQHQIVEGTVEPISKAMGGAAVKNFRISHEHTEMWLDFPEKAREFSATYQIKDNIIPMLCIRTSDVGTSSLIIRGGFRMDGKQWYEFLPGSYIFRQHTNRVDPAKLVQTASDVIFPEYVKVPERMVDLLMMPPVSDPAALTEKIMSGSGLKKLMGDGNYNKALSDMKASYGPSTYCPYDIVIRFLDLLSEYKDNRNYMRVDHIREKIMHIVFNYKF